MQKSSSSSSTACQAEITINSVLCRICYESDKSEVLITPCHCKGSIAFVHRSCLEKWLSESNTTRCELCHEEFKIRHDPRINLLYGGGFVKRIPTDIIACTVMTPVAIIITYVCLFSTDYYSQLMPEAQWTSISLLTMIGIIMIGYYVWVYSVIRMHSRMWRNWWQREYTVRYVPPPTEYHVCRHQNYETVNSATSDNNVQNETEQTGETVISIPEAETNGTGEVNVN